MRRGGNEAGEVWEGQEGNFTLNLRPAVGQLPLCLLADDLGLVEEMWLGFCLDEIHQGSLGFLPFLLLLHLAHFLLQQPDLQLLLLPIVEQTLPLLLHVDFLPACLILQSLLNLCLLLLFWLQPGLFLAEFLQCPQ